MSDAIRLAAHLDRSELVNLVFRFTQAVDRRDFETMKGCCDPTFRARATGFGNVLVDVERLEDFIAGLRAAAAANPEAMSQHRYFDPAVDLAGDRAEIRLSGEVLNATGRADDPQLRSSGLVTSYRATRKPEGWRLCALEVEYQWRRQLAFDRDTGGTA